MSKIKSGFLLIWVVFLTIGVYAEVQSPEEFLSFRVGADRKVADMHQIIEYFTILDAASNRIMVEEIGRTTMGNPFIVAFITSETNHTKLEKYRLIQQKLADPRKLSDAEAEKMIAEGRAIVMINCSIHATEIAASQMSLKLAYDLVTGEDKNTREILDNVILLLTPMHNPDGIQMVADWYRKNLGTKYEGGRMPWLYHKYVGHDNNRDWFMFTQAETKLTIKVHNAWHPQVIVDMHQMGNTGARLFVPPFVDPYEPNIDPILRQQVAMMGTFMASELTAEGKSGVIHSNRYDAWTPARAYHHYHGGVRILTEAASVKVATPVVTPFETLRPEARQESVKMPMPWKGGRWTFRDIVEYDYSAAKAALTNAARLRENWVRNYYRIFKKAVNRTDPPYAFVVPVNQRDLSVAIKMLDVLRTAGVEVHRANESFSANGHEYPSGTIVIYTAQPFGGFAKTMLERQVYPELRESSGGPLKAPYDVVGHTLPLLMGVEAVRAEKPFKVNATLQDKIDDPKGSVKTIGMPFGYVWGHASNGDIVAMNCLLKKGHAVFWAAEEFDANGSTYPAGTMLVPSKENLLESLEEISQELGVNFEGIERKPEIKVHALRLPRLGVYRSWTASMDEGWTRFVLEEHEFSYKSVYDRDIRKGKLNQDFDVIIFPDIDDKDIVKGCSEEDVPAEYAGGIGEVGIRNVKDFILSGGTLITINSAAEFGIKSLHLGVQDKVAGFERKEFFVPGSLLKVINDTRHPIAYGYPRDSAVFFRRSPVFSVSEGYSVVRYPTKMLLSGWVTGEEYLANQSGLVDIPYGRGRVILIGFPALYRSQSHVSFRYLFNSIFYGAAKKGGQATFFKN